MTLGARPIGTRTIGDGTGQSGTFTAAVQYAAVAFTAAATMSPTARTFAAVAFPGAASLTPTGAVKVDGGPLRFEARGSLAVQTRIIGDKYRVVVVGTDGTRYAELDKALLGPASWESNAAGAFEFGLPSDDPKGAKVLPIEREVQLWKGDTLLWGGPIVRPSANSADSGFQCATPEWYFSRRNFGKADRTNYVPNGDFEDGLAGWTTGVDNPLEPYANRNPIYWTARTASDRVITGVRSLYLEQLASGVPKYGVSAGQVFAWEVDPVASPDGDVWTLVAYCYIPSASWRGPNLLRAGLQLARYSTTETVTFAPEGGGASVTYPLGIEGAVASIDDLTPRDKWVRMSVSMEQRPTGDPELVQVSLKCPDGAIYWDRVSLTLEESSRFYGTDQAQIAEGIVQHLQDPAYGKSDLGIGTRCEPTGVVRDRVYVHSEHGNGFQALSEFPELDDGMDFSIEVTPDSKTFVTHFPDRGNDRSSIVLEYGRNVEDFTWAWDGQAAANSVITLGSGDGSSREEGFAIDATLFAGVTVEDVYVAPGFDAPGAIETLDNRATERLRVVSDPEILELVTNENAVPLIGVLGIGDRVTVRIHRGPVQIDGVRRIVRIVLDPPTNILTITTNRAP